MSDMMRVAAHLAAIAAEAKLAEMKVRENKYWEGELQRDIASIEKKCRDLVLITKRR